MLSSYLQYKQHTAVFTDWIASTAKHVSGKSKKMPNSVDSLLKWTNVIVGSSIADIPVEIVDSAEQALFCGFNAILLRRKISKLIADVKSDKKGNANHLHVIAVLSKCHASLSSWLSKSRRITVKTHRGSESSSDIHENPFHILSAEKTNDLETTLEETIDWTKISLQSVVSTNKTENNSSIALLCTLDDMQEIYEKIIASWKLVSLEAGSGHTAAVVTAVALRMVPALLEGLSLKNEENLVTFEDLWKRSAAEPFHEEFQHKSFLADASIIHAILQEHGNAVVSTNSAGKQKVQPVYFEEREELRLEVNNNALIAFICNELCVLRQNYNWMNAQEHKVNARFLAGTGNNGSRGKIAIHAFIDPIYRYFESKVITVEVVFVLTVWVKCVVILQNPNTRFMGKLIHAMRLVNCRLQTNFQNTAYADVMRELDVMHRMQELASLRLYSRYGPFETYAVFHHNPLLAAGFAVDQVLINLQLVTEIYAPLHIASVQLYQALKQEKFLQKEIPLLEQLEKLYHKKAFMGDVSPVAGQYVNNAMGAKIYELKHPEKRLRSSAPTASEAFRKGRQPPVNPSVLATVLLEGDLSVLCRSSYDHSPAAILDLVKQQADYEFLESRLLSMDLYTAIANCAQMLTACVQSIPRLQVQADIFREQLVMHDASPNNNNNADKHSDHNTSRSLEYTVLCPILSFLDGAHYDATNARLDAEQVVEVMCRSMGSIAMETQIYTDIHEISIVEQTFGKAVIPRVFSASLSGHSGNRFVYIMNLLDAVRKRKITLSQQELVYFFDDFGREFKRDPSIIAKVDTARDVSTVLDHCLVGTLDHLGMDTYWLAHMLVRLGGAVPHCKETGRATGLSHLQLACLYGPLVMVDLAYQATQGVDLNYVYEVDGNTAAHYAYLRGDVAIMEYLRTVGANDSIRNKEGKSIVDIARERGYAAALGGNPVKSGGKHGKKGGKGAASTVVKEVTADEIAKAKQAELELLAMLDDDHDISHGKPKKGKKGKSLL